MSAPVADGWLPANGLSRFLTPEFRGPEKFSLSFVYGCEAARDLPIVRCIRLVDAFERIVVKDLE